MSTQTDGTSRTDSPKLVRTSVLLSAETDRKLRDLADRGKRPLSWEIREALERHVETELKEAA